MSTQPTIPNQPTQNTANVGPEAYTGLPPALLNQAEQTTYQRAPSSASEDDAAYTYPNDPSTVYMTKLGQDPTSRGLSENAIVGHEAFHTLEANMPPALAAKVPQSDENNLSDPAHNAEVYGIDDVDDLRKQGKTITDLPNEKGAAIVQEYINSGGKAKNLQPWIDDLQKVPQSVIMPTLPGQKGINTEPRTPGPPVEMAESEVHNPPPAKAVPKKFESAKQAAKPVEKKSLTTSAKKVYNSTKSALGGS